MNFVRSDVAFEPGLFANRTKRASRNRWVDGNLVRFRDGTPAQMGGWRKLPVAGPHITGRARGIIGWRLNDQAGRLCAIGTEQGCWLFDGGALSNITPVDLGPGRVDSSLGSGFGGGLYGKGLYGTERTGSGLLLPASTWSFDMFGEILLGCFSSDGLIRSYHDGVDATLTTIGTAPRARAICVSAERHVFAFGCDDNPRLVRWSDRENYSVWAPLATNRAGSYELQSTSTLLCGRRVRGQVIAWTETEVFTFFPLNNALVYGRETLSESVGAAGPLSVAVATWQGGETAFWLGVDGFYMFDGAVRRMDCELQDYVFGDINLLQRAKFEASTNVEWSEVRFSYCSGASNEIDRCVVFCFSNNTWTKANVARLSWLDRRVFSKPIAVDAAGDIFEHEVGFTADGLPMDSFVTSHPVNVGSGEQFAEIADFWPDLDPATAGAALTIIGRDYPNAPDVQYGPYVLAATTEKVDLNIAVRQFQMKFSGTGGYWELGLPQITIQGGSMR